MSYTHAYNTATFSPKVNNLGKASMKQKKRVFEIYGKKLILFNSHLINMKEIVEHQMKKLQSLITPM